MELRTPPATAKGPATTFTGDAWLDRFADGGDESRLVASTVRFTPGARTHWHSHPLGQTLHCTDGVGLVATRDGRVIILRMGQTVWTPPGEEHWHGATRDNLMCHLALVVTTPEGASATLARGGHRRAVCVGSGRGLRRADAVTAATGVGEVVVVIGGGSIGQAIARRVSAGKHVVLADLRQDNADAAAEVMATPAST